MKIDPEYVSNEDIDWQRQSQRTYAKLSLKISQTKTRAKKDKETNKNKDNKKTRTRIIKKHLWKSGLKISQSCNWVLNHRCLWCLNIFGVGKSPIMRQVFNPECFSKMQTQIILLNININLISEFVQNIFCNCSLKMVKKSSWSFHWHQTSWMKLLVLKHAVSFYIAILGKILPVVDGKDWQVCGNDGSISVNLRINMIKPWKNATSSRLCW